MKTEQIIKRPLIDLPKISEKMKTLDISAAIGYYSNLAKRAAFISEYLSERYGYRCGDRGHAKALKALVRGPRLQRLFRRLFLKGETCTLSPSSKSCAGRV